MAAPADLTGMLPLSDIDSVVFYKRDEITTDLVCCDVELRGQTWTFHEEAAAWDGLLTHLEQLPGFRKDWAHAVIKPAFAVNETVAYRRV